jgi:hypothetical protein
MINLKDLERKLDDALSKESPETLTSFINEKRQNMNKKVKTEPNEPINPIVYDTIIRHSGLTKREYFAAMALQGLLVNNNNDYAYSVISSVEYADALIDELNK